eukprot:4857436-Heterocapsa_arctica.AAC.1
MRSGRTGDQFDAVIVFLTDSLLKAKPMTISHNSVIACEEIIDYTFIDYIYIRTPEKAVWLLYDRDLSNCSIKATGRSTWSTRDVTYGQNTSMIRAHGTEASAGGDDWPCNTQPCPSCSAIQPVGFT